MLIMLNAARYFQAKDDFEVINEFILFRLIQNNTVDICGVV